MDMLSKTEFKDTDFNGSNIDSNVKPIILEERETPSSDEPPQANTKASKSKLFKQIAVPVGVLLFGIAVVGLISLMEQPAEKKPDAASTVKVETLLIESGEVTFAIQSQGTVNPRTETKLVSEVSGVVQNLSPKLQVGGFFEKGEILLSIDASDYQAAVKQAEANLLSRKAKLTQEIAQSQQAEKEWAITGRPKEDAPVLALRQPFLEEAKAAVLFAEAELDQARRKLDRTQIRAPYDGLVKSKNIGVGQYLTVGTQLAELFAVDYAEVRLALSDAELAFLQLPNPQVLAVENESSIDGVAVTIKAKVGGKEYFWPAIIRRTEGVIDSRSRVHYAVAQITDPYGLHSETNKPALSFGSFVKADIQGITVNDVFVVPRDAFRDENTLLVVDSENSLHLREANVIRSDNHHVYITSGINPGDEVVLTGMTAPVEGMSVEKVLAR